jgi:hypothetical protein
MDLTVRSETFGADNQTWLASQHGLGDVGRPVTLDTSAFTAGTHYPQGFFKSGIPLGRITATGKYAPYNNALSDGTEVLAGFLLTPIKAAADTTVDPVGALMEHGQVVEANLPIAIDAAGKADVAGRIIFR